MQFSCCFQLSHTASLSHLRTHIFQRTDGSVSAECSFIINLDSGAEWVDAPYCKVNPKATVSHIVQAGQSLSPVWPLGSRTLWRIGAEPEFRQRTVSSCSLRAGVHSAPSAPIRNSVFDWKSFFPLQQGHVVEIGVKSYRRLHLHSRRGNTVMWRKMNFQWRHVIGISSSLPLS